MRSNLSSLVTREPLQRGPRERALEDGVKALGDVDLLAILLGTGFADRPVGIVAAMLLDHAGGLDRLARLGPAAIADQPGLGPAKALRIAAAMEIGRRASRERRDAAIELTTSASVAELMRAKLGPLVHEEMWVLSLDGRNHLRGLRRVAQGGLHGCSVGARDVLRAALFDAAAAFVVVHNHPSGDPSPSEEDLDMTRALEAAAMVVGCPLLDHVILGGEEHASMLDLGVLG